MQQMYLKEKKLAEEEKAKALRLKKEKHANAEELLTLIAKQAAAPGVEQDQDALLTATLLARSARSEQEIEELKAKVKSLEITNTMYKLIFFIGGLTCYVYH